MVPGEKSLHGPPGFELIYIISDTLVVTWQHFCHSVLLCISTAIHARVLKLFQLWATLHRRTKANFHFCQSCSMCRMDQYFHTQKQRLATGLEKHGAKLLFTWSHLTAVDRLYAVRYFQVSKSEKCHSVFLSPFTCQVQNLQTGKINMHLSRQLDICFSLASFSFSEL